MCIDSHIHLMLDGFNARQRPRKESLFHIERTLKTYVDRGIFFLRDGGDNQDLVPAARDIAQKLGVIYKSPIHSFYKRGEYGGFSGKAVGDLSEFKDMFDSWVKKRPDHMKIVLTGNMDFDHFGHVGDVVFSREDLHYMIQSAKDKDLPVMVHACSRKGVKMAIEAGATSIEHGYLISDEELHMMADMDILWVPILSSLGNILYAGDVRSLARQENIKRTYEIQLGNIKRASDMGVKMALGSNAGAFGVFHGRGFYDEIGHWERAGLDRTEIFSMAIENGIRALNLSSEEVDALKKALSVTRSSSERGAN